ncbi:hypothetical protein GILI108418_08845 [Gillisia limnaea]
MVNKISLVSLLKEPFKQKKGREDAKIFEL